MILDPLERAARVARTVGLGAVVDGIGPAVGRAAARRGVEIDGFRVAGNHAGQLFYLRELRRDRREAYLAELIARLTPAGGVAVDAGAHIGYLTLHLARAVGAGGGVVAFEPDPETRVTLAKNLRRNGVDGRVTILGSALAERKGHALLHLRGGGETSSLVDPVTARRSVEVEVVTLDEALAGSDVDVIKLDIEGGECAALEGMQAIFARSSSRLVLFVECNPSALAAAGRSAEELLARLSGAGFDVLEIDEERCTLVAPSIPTAEGAYVNLVCARDARLADVQRLAA